MEEGLTADCVGTLKPMAAPQDGMNDEHAQEGTAIAFERARIEASLSPARAHLADIDDALNRLRDGTHGAREGCGNPIGAELLATRPTERPRVACAG